MINRHLKRSSTSLLIRKTQLRTTMMEKKMTTCSNIPAWDISWTEEPGGQQSMGSQRVRHDLVTDNNKYTIRQMVIWGNISS